jgi:hypothetical protein
MSKRKPPIPLPPVDPGIEIVTSSVKVPQNPDELSASVSWRISERMEKLLQSGAWRLDFSLESVGPGGDYQLADFSVPVVPGSLSYTEESKIKVGTVPEGVYKLISMVTHVGAYSAPGLVAYHEQLIQITHD